MTSRAVADPPSAVTARVTARTVGRIRCEYAGRTSGVTCPTLAQVVRREARSAPGERSGAGTWSGDPSCYQARDGRERIVDHPSSCAAKAPAKSPTMALSTAVSTPTQNSASRRALAVSVAIRSSSACTSTQGVRGIAGDEAGSSARARWGRPPVDSRELAGPGPPAASRATPAPRANPSLQPYLTSRNDEC